MKISYNWLKRHINTTLSVDEISVILTDIGLEVEGVSSFESVKGGLEGLVIGEIKEVSQHPNADRLQLTKVDVKHSDLLDIVCGAPNVAVGQKVVVALVGATLYPDEKGFKIKKSKIRGEVSEGMLCAEDEIGLGESHDGIMVLDGKAEAGSAAADYFKVSGDVVFEIGLTPNRIDAASHYGVARDLAAFLKLNETVEFKEPSILDFKTESQSSLISVDIQDEHDCPRYSALTIENLSIKESPAWLQNYLKAIGLKPVNNVVDATNFILHDIGQPLHAFDLDKIKGNRVSVKKLKEGTIFKTLDGVERKLSSEDLMICNDDEPMCIAGVFGGESSGVTSKTNSIFLESAYFNPVCIRKTAKRHGLNTDASFRYERGTDPNITIKALKQAALLIQELAGGQVSSEVLDIYPNPIENHIVELYYSKINQLIGEDIPKETIKAILLNLEIEVLNESEEFLRLSVPAYRVDVLREVDLIEEVLRIYGYNRIKLPGFLRSNISSAKKISPIKIENKVANYLTSNGFAEVFNNSLSNPNYYLNKQVLVTMLNPLSKETEVLRSSMLYGGLENISYNQNRKRKSLSFYEFGKTYLNKKEEGFAEKSNLAIWITGNKTSESWESKQEPVDFFALKNQVENIFNLLGVENVKGQASTDGRFVSSFEFIKGKNQLVVLGKLNKLELKKFGIKEEVFFAEFNWSKVLDYLSGDTIQYKAVSKFPIVRRDLALLLDTSVEFSQIRKIAKETEKRLLKETNLFDVYEGKNLEQGKKSYAVSFFFQDDSKTLTDGQIDKVIERLISALKKELNAVLR